jgi:hypothetical protein
VAAAPTRDSSSPPENPPTKKLLKIDK